MPMVVPLSRHYGCRRRVERSPDPGASEELENVRNAMVKELLTIDEDAPVSLAPAAVSPADNVALMFERLAKDPAVDVEKFERLMAMQERILAHNARSEYYAAFAEMQGKLPTVEERGESNNGKYALHEDIVEAVRPVLKEFGFILTHRTNFPDATTVRVVGI